jgi:hypothetical protein
MSTSQNPGAGSFQSGSEPPDGPRSEADTPALAARGRDLGVDQLAVDRRCADFQHQHAIGFAQFQPAVPLKRRQQRRDHHLKPLAADPIRRLPQRHHCILDDRAVGRLPSAWPIKNDR